MHNHVQHASVFILTPSFSSPFALPLRRTALALLLAGCFGAAQANPALPQVVNGQATFNQQGNIFSITNTPNTIINWQSFSIHAGEITRFIQQNGNSAVLNRITGQDPSKILGALESNGKVFLINPNGIVFGQGAKVDVNGLVASSLGMTNEDFLAGKRQFTAGGVAGGVSNAGLIQAGKGGQVLLIAPNVENTGIITAPNGEVILAAGRSVQLADPGNPQLRVLVSAPADQALNLGQIIAQGGSIGMAGALVSQRGVLNANSAIVGENGRIVLKASGKALLEAGSVTSATGAVGKGGDIQVLGEQVGLLGNAAIDASGATGGGTVLLGGDYQGKNAAVQNARQVLVGKDASVNADAIHGGNGGKVIAWGNESAQVHGSISARGGAQGGDGGFVETSGHYLAVDGIRVNTSAAHGKRGNWLLDPYDITVVAGSGGQLSSFDQFADSPATGNASIGADLISGASSNVTLQALHRINFNSAINIAQQGVGLTAQAGEIINVNAPITTNGGHITLSANDAAAGMAYGVGSNVNLNATLGSGNGDVRLSGAGVTFGVGSVNVGNGNLTLRANVAGGSIDLTGSGDQLLGSGVTGQTVLLEADNISINGAINVGGAAGNAGVTLQAFSAGRQIALGDKPGSGLRLTNAELNRIAAGSVHIGSAAGGDLTVEQAIDLATVAADGGVKNLVLESGGNVLVSNTLALRQDGSSITATAGGLLSLASGGGLSAGAVNLVADNMSLGGGAQSIAATAGGTVSLNRRSSVGAITLGSGAADNAGSLGLSEAELKTISAGTVQVGGDSFTGVVNLVGAMDLASQGELNQLVLRTGGNINLNGPLSVAKGLTLASGNNISASGAVSVGGDFLLDGGRWVQNSASLPAFSARGFSIAQGSFLRAAGGDGGSSSPYLIADIHGLQGIGSLGLGNSYRLAGNIDASGTASWNDGQGFVPIAGSGSGFSGVFDGAGFTLSNLKIDRSLASGSAAGLFGTVQGGTLRNLTLSGGSVTGTANVGALAGEVVSGNIDGVNSSMAVSGQRNVGGLVGSNGGAITLSASSGAVTGINADGGGAIGGLAGLNASGASITTSYATGVVTGAREMIGGLVGNNQGALSQSYATGNVTGARSIGGLVGLNGGSIDDAYASGAVGRAGVADPILAWENMGGLVGESTGSVSHVFSSGAVTGSGYAAVGAVAGRVSSGSPFSYGFFNYETSLVLMDGGGSSGRSTAQMKQQGMFNDYNFSSVWRIYDGYTTPMLKAFLKPLQVNLSGNAAGKVYDGQLAAFLGSIGYVGLIDGDTGVNGSLGYGSNARNVGSYAATGLWSTKYDISLGGTTTFAITPRALTVSIGGNGKIYDGTLGYDGANFVLGNVVAGDNISISGSAAFLDKNAGNGKAVHASGLALGGNELGNYSLAATTADGTADISARVLNYGVTGAQSRVYDGTLQAGLNGYFEGLVTGDQVSMTGLQGSFRDKHVGTGKVVDYQVATGQLTGADAGNYVLNGNAGSTTADITARVLNYGVTGAQSRVYDGTLQAGLNGYFEGLVTGDQVSMAGLQGSFRDKHVGTGKVVDYQVATGQLTGADAGNYVLNGNAGSTTADITARVLNYGVTGAQSRVYDGTLQAGLNGYFEGLVTGDQVSMTGLQGSFRDKHVGTGKVVDYQVATGQLTGADAGNYVLNGNAGSTTADITARVLNYGVTGAQSRVYDGTLQAGLNGYFEGLVTGDQVSMAGLQGSFRDKHVGTGKVIDYQVATGQLTGADAGNYVLNGNVGSTTADIAARTLNVSFNGVNKTYDGTTGAQVHFGDDRIQGDALTVAGNAAFGNKNAGAGKAVNVTDVALSGGDAGNYVLGSNAGSTTADIAARTLNVSFNGVNKTYDGTTGAQVHFGDDRIQGDALSVSGSAAFGNRNAGAGKAVNVTDVALSGGDAGNYVLGSNAGSTTADIAARTLNVSFNGVNKTYDGTTGAQVHFGDDRIQGDALSVSGSAAFGNKNAGAGKAVNVSNVALSGSDAGNYVLSSNAGSTTADIAARALNLSGVVGSKVYDGTTGAQLSLGDDRIAGDSLTASAVASFADKNVGAAKAVQLSGAALTGADAGNYFIVLPTGLLASITPASLTLAGVSAAGKVYDGTTSAAVSASANGVLGQDVVSVVGGSGSFADKNAGTGKLVTASGFRLAGADAGNYTLETTGGTAQASIAQKQLSTWVGSGSGLWSDAANWDGGVVPEGANVLAVDFSNSKGIVTYSAAAGSTILKNLNSATGLLLTGGSLTLGESALDLSVLSGLAGLEINGGSLLLNGNLSADRYAQGGGLLSGNGNLLVANSFSQAAGAIRLAGQLAITQAAGDLRFASLAANEVKLSALNGAIGQDGALLASSLAAQARDGIVLGNAGNQVGSFTASNSAGGGIALNNTSAPGTLTLGTLTTGAGNIAIDNTGGVAAGNINANGGNVSVTAHSPVTVNGKIEGNDIALNASTDVLLGDGAQLAAARNVSLTAGRDIHVGGNAQIVSGGNFSATAEGHVRFADTASVALPAASSMSVLAKTGSITGDTGVRINRQRSGVILLAPNGTVSMADAIFLPATTIDKPVIDAATSAAIDDALRIIKQADRANDTLASTPPAKLDDKKPDSKDVADAADKPTGYKFDDPTKKMYCN
ncbi:YDG domain-containing protein [Janthinobacterium lividum]|uniref:YDG domain-containing protein n=1 Tax=Janthinobacterium lividum TaxID=29581 RepID=UPI001595F31A|nr:YDG domain-containing protein [Janthinobacterium lividum]QKY10380.1 filamentous hemagglutinin N-terminal domain-containing protein [Janthinobacterium lividum]